VGTNIRLFNDIFIYNVLSATKFINSMLKKEGCVYDVVCVHDWLSSIAGIIIKNETKFLLFFMFTARNGEEAEGKAQRLFLS
jgi:hypothetical protein